MKNFSEAFHFRLINIISAPLFEGADTSPYIFFLVKDMLDNKEQYKADARKEVKELKKTIGLKKGILFAAEEIKKDEPLIISKLIRELKEGEIKLHKGLQYLNHLNTLSPEKENVVELFMINKFRLN
ncbi:MAG: hypothetical protein JJE25_13805 [Bacteroidia bacterium]|nr:hypothetical protein [Bacteroidia bacterium]